MCTWRFGFAVARDALAEVERSGTGPARACMMRTKSHE